MMTEALEVQQDRAEDGYWIDPETGEILGHEELQPAFVPDDLTKAAWVLRKREKALGRVAALKAARDAEIAQVAMQYERCIGQAEKRAAFWDGYLPDLERLAQVEVEGSRARSISLGPWRLGFRTSSSLEILDEGAAVDWARENAPDAVQTRVSLLKTALRKAGELPAHLFQTLTTTRFYVETVGE